MRRSDAAVVLMTSVATDADAVRIATDLVEHHLAACVQIQQIRSFYRWEGKIHDESELLLLIKTSARLLDEVEVRVREIHPYEVPELIALRSTAVSAPYLEWIEESVKYRDRR